MGPLGSAAPQPNRYLAYVIMVIRGVIFDFNGTLIWDSSLQEAAWKEFSAQIRGQELSDSEFEQEVHGRTNSHTLQYLLGRDLDDNELKELAGQKERIYRSLCSSLGSKFCLAPGADRVLDELTSSEVPITIATASGLDNLQFFIKAFDLSRWFEFDKIVFDDGTFPGKPAPDIFIKAARSLNLRIENCVVVEDAISGITAAREAGVGKIVAIAPSDRQSAFRAMEEINFVIESFNELSVERLLQAR